MKIQLENTTKIVTRIVDGHEVPARVWEGATEGGIPCYAFITRIACKNGLDTDASEFERDLKEQRPPSAEMLAFPARMIL